MALNTTMFAVQGTNNNEIVAFQSVIIPLNSITSINLNDSRTNQIAPQFIINASPVNLYDSNSHFISQTFVPSHVISYKSTPVQNMQIRPKPIQIPKQIKKKPKDHKNQRKKFSPEEDEKLKELVEKMGSKKWETIAKEMPGRTGRQCRDRYKNYLIPGFFNGQWSREEDELLFKKYIEFGSQWSKITQFFSNRSSNALKNRWNYFVSRNLKFDTNYETNQSIVKYNDDNLSSYDNYSNNESNDDSDDSNQNNDGVCYEGIINYPGISNPYLDGFDFYENENTTQNDDFNYKDDVFNLNID